MTVSTKPMPNMATTVRAVIVAVLALALALAGVPRAASLPSASALDTGPAFATFEISNGDFPIAPGAVEQLGLWWKCSGAAYWSGPGSNEPPNVFAPVLYLKGSCERGFSMGDETLKVKAVSAGCGDWTATFGNVDEANMRPFTRELVNSWEDYNEGAGCQPIVELCFQDESFFTGDYAEGDWKCVPLGLQAPPPMENEGNDWQETGAAGCPVWTPLTPWVSSPQAVAVAGGWAWRSTVTIQVDGWDNTDLLDGEYPVPQAMARVPGGMSAAEELSTSGEWQPVTPQSGWLDATFFYGTSGAPPITSRTMRAYGPVHTGALGSVPPDWQWIGAGVYWSETNLGFTNNTGNHPEHHTTRPSSAAIAADRGEYGAHHDPGRCHFWWGNVVFPTDTSGYKDPAGPLVERSTEQPPAPVVVYVPPTVEVGDDCTASTADVCVENPEPPPGQMPDPDSEECDLSAWDPTTYPQQAECALARVVQAIVVTSVAILDTLGEILDELGRLFLPPDDLWPDLWGRFEQEWEDSALDDWTAALASLVPDSDVTENCQGPAFGPVELLHDGPGGSDVEVPAMYPLDACGDKEPIAHSVRAIIAAGVTLGGAWRMWDMVTGSLGAYRGGGRHMSEKEWI